MGRVSPSGPASNGSSRRSPTWGDGLLGIQAGADWWSWDYGFSGGNTSVSYIPIGVTANYHFRKIDPFLGAGLGYQVVNASCEYQGVDYCGSYLSAIYFITKGGIRYFMNPSTSLYADVGAGAATLNIGGTFRLK